MVVGVTRLGGLPGLPGNPVSRGDNLPCKGLITWRWGTPSRWGNLPSRGRKIIRVLNTPLNSIKFHKSHGTEQNKRLFSQIMCRVIYITYGNFKSFHIICPQIFEIKASGTTLNQPMIWNPKLKEINSTASMLAKILTYVSHFFHCV